MPETVKSSLGAERSSIPVAGPALHRSAASMARSSRRLLCPPRASSARTGVSVAAWREVHDSARTSCRPAAEGADSAPCSPYSSGCGSGAGLSGSGCAVPQHRARTRRRTTSRCRPGTHASCSNAVPRVLRRGPGSGALGRRRTVPRSSGPGACARSRRRSVASGTCWTWSQSAPPGVSGQLGAVAVDGLHDVFDAGAQ